MIFFWFSATLSGVKSYHFQNTSVPTNIQIIGTIAKWIWTPNFAEALYGSASKPVNTWAKVKLKAWRKIANRPKNCWNPAYTPSYRLLSLTTDSSTTSPNTGAIIAQYPPIEKPHINNAIIIPSNTSIKMQGIAKTPISNPQITIIFLLLFVLWAAMTQNGVETKAPMRKPAKIGIDAF